MCWLTQGSKGLDMGKGDNQRGNKEAKKPKKEKPKVLATANANVGKDAVNISNKKK
jgi:hypothetical protein